MDKREGPETQNTVDLAADWNNRHPAKENSGPRNQQDAMSKDEIIRKSREGIPYTNCASDPNPLHGE